MSVPFAAFDRLKQTLQSSGLNEEASAFILEKLRHSVSDRVAAEVVTIGGEEAVNKLSMDNSEAQLAELEAQFKEKKGKSIAEFREDLASQMVAEFEAAG